MLNWKQKIHWTVLIVVIVAVVAVAYFSSHHWEFLKKDGGENSEILRNIALTIGGIFALYALTLAGIRNQIMQENQVSESLAKAAEQLANSVMSVRILAILSLGKIAIAGDEQTCRDVIEVLCAYIREKRPVGNKDNNPPFTEDMQQIIKVLGKIQDKKPDYSRGYINLSHTDLSGVELANANMSGFLLWRTDLSGANLWQSNLSGAKLSHANLSGAELVYADLQSADLLGVDTHLLDVDLSLSPTNFRRANLSGAILQDAKLMHADLAETDLSGADLSGANLSGANLSGADLSGANLSYADLPHANLWQSNLLGANLSNVGGLDMADGLKTVKNSPQEIFGAIEMRKRGGYDTAKDEKSSKQEKE